MISIDTGKLRFNVVPTRGMSLWKAWLGEHIIGWNSPVRGPVHPGFVQLTEPSGAGFLDGPTELMFRCGLESNGKPDFDETGRLRYPLHGRIANLPAHFVEVIVDPTTESIRIRGVVEECRFLQQKLRLTTEYVADILGSSIKWTDRVENIGGTHATLQMLYHTNIGEPFLDAGSTLVAPVSTVCPRDRFAIADGPENWHTYPPERPDSWEQVYFLDIIGDALGETEVLLHNAEGAAGVGLRFNCNTLPCFTQWRNTQAKADGYVTGIEPGTNFPNPRSFEERHGRVVTLAPSEAWTSEVALDIHDDETAVEASKMRIAELQGNMPTRVCTEPMAEWSAES